MMSEKYPKLKKRCPLELEAPEKVKNHPLGMVSNKQGNTKLIA